MYIFHIFVHKFSEMYTMHFIGKYFEIFSRILKFLTHKPYINIYKMLYIFLIRIIKQNII